MIEIMRKMIWLPLLAALTGGLLGNLFATLLWFLVALWSPVTIVAWFSFLTDSLVRCGTLVFVAGLIGGATFLLVRGAALLLVFSLVGVLTFSFILGLAFCLICCLILGCIGGRTLLFVMSLTLAFVHCVSGGNVNSLWHISTFWL